MTDMRQEPSLHDWEYERAECRHLDVNMFTGKCAHCGLKMRPHETTVKEIMDWNDGQPKETK